MLVREKSTPLRLGGLSATLAAFSATIGLLDPGIYRPFTPPHLMPGTASQDIGTLLVASLVFWSVGRVRSGDGRFWLIWLGAMGYLAYGYAIYVFEAVINAVFPVYIAVLSLSLWSVITFCARVRLKALSTGDAPRKRLTAFLFVLLSLMFAVLWSTILADSIAAGARPDGLTILALDFTFVLPLLCLSAVLLWRGRLLGDLLAVPLLIKAGSIGLSVLLGTLLSPLYGLELNLGEVATYLILGLCPIALIPSWMRSLRGTQS